MADAGSIRALLLEGDANSAVLTRDMLDDASAGLVDLVHVEQLAPAIERLASESFDVILFRALALGQPGTERIDRLLLQAPGVPIIVLALLPDVDLELPMIRYGAQDFWVDGRDSGAALVRAMRYAIERKPRLEQLAHQANFDRLTDLPNRYLFEDRLATPPPGRSGRTARLPCCMSTLMISRRSTIGSAIARATTCCAVSPGG
jgi:PleD family two-component response regulator